MFFLCAHVDLCMNPLVGPIKLNASVKFHPFNLTYNYTLLEIKVKWFIFIIMKKVCKYCGIEKDIDSYYKKISSTDGHQSVCKICTSIVTREYREIKLSENPPVEETKKDTKTLSLVGSTMKDYCMMYSAMDRLGYSPSGDIHIQFMNKWGLKVSNRPRKGPVNQFSYQDCKE